jgi:hypothetical protein
MSAHTEPIRADVYLTCTNRGVPTLPSRSGTGPQARTLRLRRSRL